MSTEIYLCVYIFIYAHLCTHIYIYTYTRYMRAEGEHLPYHSGPTLADYLPGISARNRGFKPRVYLVGCWLLFEVHGFLEPMHCRTSNPTWVTSTVYVGQELHPVLLQTALVPRNVPMWMFRSCPCRIRTAAL